MTKYFVYCGNCWNFRPTHINQPEGTDTWKQHYARNTAIRKRREHIVTRNDCYINATYVANKESYSPDDTGDWCICIHLTRRT